MFNRFRKQLAGHSGVLASAALLSCTGTAARSGSDGVDAAQRDASHLNAADDASVIDGGIDSSVALSDAAPATGTFCALAGSLVWTAQGTHLVAGVPGSSQAPDLSWLHLPPGFCAHYFGTVKTARQLKFAPGGDLFVASPTTPTTGGANNGIAGIVVLPDDNHDGVADTNLTFLASLPSTQGLMFTAGYLYFQDGPTIRRLRFQSGDRRPSGPVEVATTITAQQDGLHWPKVFDAARDGTVFVSNGSSQGEQCNSSRAPFGAIFKLGANGTTTEVMKGFRNPIAMRCESDHDVCLVVELALDYSWSSGGREKIVPIEPNADWGFPCCATRDIPYSGATYSDTGRTPDCSAIAMESNSFIIGHTPFGLDFEPGRWPAPWTRRVFVTLHGDNGQWSGARVVAIPLDATTGLPLPATELVDASPAAGNMTEFASGWDDGMRDHGRPAPIAFAPDGRLFLGDDQLGAIIWVAPVDLPSP
ncbi:MAG: hypothetical protein M3O50_04595 [Myxococcota bacterium]|nr:hypothetical protein [Myxococcota bacterium]